MRKLLNEDEFRDAAKRGESPEDSVQKLAVGPAEAVAGDARTLRFCFSDGTVDRAGDAIDPSGWELASFKQNPVALWAHDSYSPPIGRASNVAVIGGKLMGDIEFASAETYAFADTIYRLAKDGFIKAVSVGFRALKWAFVNESDRPYGIDFQKQELLEISICPVPCNANALAEAKAAGIDIGPMLKWAEAVMKSMPAEMKAGKRISKDNMARLQEACDHIKGVMDSNGADDDASDDGDDDPNPEPEPVKETHIVELSARDRARATLAEARAAQSRDLTPNI